MSRGLLRDRRGATALEFAIVATAFLALIFSIFEIGYDLFEQEELDTALHLAVRQMQTGNAQNATSGANFITQYVCPNLGGLLTCNNIYINVQKIAPTNNGQTSTLDFYDYTTGTPPTTGGQLNLAGFSGGGASSASFCNASADQLLLVTALYVRPSFLLSFLPGITAVAYNGSYVQVTMSTTGLISENFSPAATNNTPAPSC